MYHTIYDAKTNTSKQVPLTDAEKAERTAGDAELAEIAYSMKRQLAYPSVGDQLDDLYKKGAFSTDMAAKLTKVKSDNPKP